MNEIVETSVATIPTAVLTSDEAQEEVFVAASDPQQMMVAQQRLIRWADRKVVDETKERDDLLASVEEAKAHKWKTSTLQAAASRSQKRVEFYEKIAAALAAGYVIVPNVPVDVFAIRTQRRDPKRNQVRGDWSRPPLQQTEAPPQDEGEYVSPEAVVHQQQVAAPTQHDPKNTTFVRWAEEFKEVEFPFTFARPNLVRHRPRDGP